MAEEMSLEEEINNLLDKEPFAPFTIVVTSGDRYRVVNPRALAMLGSVCVVLEPHEGSSTFRKNQIVSVEHRPARNGRRRGK